MSVFTRSSVRPVSVSSNVGLSGRLKKQGKPGIPHPDLATTAQALNILDRSGAAMIELGLPYSHPFLDGPVIQASVARALANDNNLDSILLLSMVKMVSSNGVTGVQNTVNPQVESLLKDIKQVTNKPIAVGFGISKPEHVRQVVKWGADGVIVGSALVKLMAEARSPDEGLRELESFTKSLTSALNVSCT